MQILTCISTYVCPYVKTWYGRFEHQINAYNSWCAYPHVCPWLLLHELNFCYYKCLLIFIPFPYTSQAHQFPYQKHAFQSLFWPQLSWLLNIKSTLTSIKIGFFLRTKFKISLCMKLSLILLLCNHVNSTFLQ